MSVYTPGMLHGIPRLAQAHPQTTYAWFKVDRPCLQECWCQLRPILPSPAHPQPHHLSNHSPVHLRDTAHTCRSHTFWRHSWRSSSAQALGGGGGEGRQGGGRGGVARGVASRECSHPLQAHYVSIFTHVTSHMHLALHIRTVAHHIKS